MKIVKKIKARCKQYVDINIKHWKDYTASNLYSETKRDYRLEKGDEIEIIIRKKK